MALRISQRMIYSNMQYGMNKSLNDYMDLHAQNTSQKRVNRPADDPYGTAQIMQSRNTLSSITQYRDNLNMAKGWISATDGALELMQEQLVDLQTILQQGATGTIDAAQRRGLAERAQGILDQIINLSNTQFGGRHIFSGHKTDTSAYTRALGAHSNDTGLNGVTYRASGDTSKTVLIQIDENVPAGTPLNALGGYTPPFRYSDDGGQTWKTDGACTVSGNDVTFTAGGVVLEVKDTSPPSAQVGGVNFSNESSKDNGSWIYVRPTAQYHGDTKAVNVVQSYPSNATYSGKAQGSFSGDVSVRLDNVTGTEVEYSYSTDNGATWTAAKVPMSGGNSTLYLPGGHLEMTGLAAGDTGQMIVKPYSADIEMTIGSNASIVVNNVGLDVLGGLYQAPFESDLGPQPVNGYGKDLFELIGKAISSFETNSQQGCQEVLGELEKTMEYVTGFRTQAGARANRVASIENQLEFLEYDEEGRLSTIEDADLSELLTKLSQQQLAYNSVLKSSSMIMQLSLMNFL